jgi:tetratricopeptide (TPR) repeat protein
MLKALIYALFGLRAGAFHAVSLLLHGATAVFIFSLMTHLLTRALPTFDARSLKWAALGATVLYAANPLRAEVVAWASGQPYVLAAFFTVLAALIYVRTFENPEVRVSRRVVGLGLATLAYACAVLSKTAALPLPLVFFVMDVYPLQRLNIPSVKTRGTIWYSALGLAVEKIPMFFIAAGITWITAGVGAEAAIPPESVDFSARVQIAGANVLFYIVKSVVPIGLSPFYGLPMPFEGLPSRYWVEASLAALLTLAIVLLRRRAPGLAAAWTAYLIILVPVCGIVRHGDQLAADRYAHLSTIGLFAVAGAGLLLVSGRLPTWGRRQLIVLGGAAYLAMAALSVRQTLLWGNTERLWRHALKTDPLNWLAATDLASYYVHDAGRPREALDLVEPVVQRCGTYADARITLGAALEKLGRDDEAIKQFEQAVRLKPLESGVLYYAAALHRRGRLDEAIIALRDRVARPPVSVDAFVNLGCYLLEAGRTDEGEQMLRWANQQVPWNPRVCFNLAALALNGGRNDEAEHWLRRTLELDRSYPRAREHLEDLQRKRQVP